MEKVKWFALALSILTFILGLIEWELLFKLSGQEWIAPTRTIIDELFSAAALITFLSFGSVRYPYQNLVGQLGAKSYGIYLIHTLPIVIAARGIYHFLPAILEISDHLPDYPNLFRVRNPFNINVGCKPVSSEILLSLYIRMNLPYPNTQSTTY